MTGTLYQQSYQEVGKSVRSEGFESLHKRIFILFHLLIMAENNDTCR